MLSYSLILCLPFSFCLWSFPALESFPMSQLFTSSGQSIGASVSATVIPSEYSGLISFRTDWFDLLALAQLLIHVQLFVTPWTAAHQASLSFTISQSLLKLMSIESMLRSNHLNLWHLLLLLPWVFPSVRIFFNKLALPIRWPKYWSFSLSPSNEYSGLISFRID